jgi:hypothetical protein
LKDATHFFFFQFSFRKKLLSSLLTAASITLHFKTFYLVITKLMFCKIIVLRMLMNYKFQFLWIKTQKKTTKKHKKKTHTKKIRPSTQANRVWQYRHPPLIYWPHSYLKVSWLFIKSQASPTLWQTSLEDY